MGRIEQEDANAIPRHRGKCAFQVRRAFDGVGSEVYPERLDGVTRFGHGGDARRICRIHEVTDAGEPRQHILRQLRPLRARAHRRNASDIAAGPAQVAHYAGADGIGHEEHDGRVWHCALRDARGNVSDRHDDADVKPRELGREFRQTLHAVLAEAIFDDDVFALDIAKLARFSRR